MEKNLIIPYNFNKFKICNNLKKDHELRMIFATLVIGRNPNLRFVTKARACKGEG